MIIERSSYAGMGKFASRWLGDNFAQPEYMGYSVTGIMSHNIMGITLAGSDISDLLTIPTKNFVLDGTWLEHSIHFLEITTLGIQLLKNLTQKSSKQPILRQEFHILTSCVELSTKSMI